jgi:hypothetical protein
MDIKQEFREEKNMDVYATNVNDGSFSNVYVKWLEAKLTLTDVSQQRELLKSCFLALDEVSRDNAIITDEDAFIDEVIKDFNCG